MDKRSSIYNRTHNKFPMCTQFSNKFRTVCKLKQFQFKQNLIQTELPIICLCFAFVLIFQLFIFTTSLKLSIYGSELTAAITYKNYAHCETRRARSILDVAIDLHIELVSTQMGGRLGILWSFKKLLIISNVFRL